MSTVSLDFDQLVKAPRHAVWEAISTPSGIAAWWVTGDVAPTVGHQFALDMGQWGEVPCVVTEVVAGEVLRYTFGVGQTEWPFTWTLSDVTHGTNVHLTHAGFDLSDQQHAYAHVMMGQGWKNDVLPRLARVVESQAQ